MMQVLVNRVLCTTVAVELVEDGDTLQMGVGTVSASLGRFLDFGAVHFEGVEIGLGQIRVRIQLADRGLRRGRRRRSRSRFPSGSEVREVDVGG